MTAPLHVLDDFVAEGRQQFTTSALRERLDLTPQATSNLIARWRRDGLVDQVARGRYAIRPLGALGTRSASQDVALAVATAFGTEPHRLAFRSALDFHGLITHPARTIQVASPLQRRMTSISGRKLRVVRESAASIAVGAEATPAGAFVSGHLRSLIDVAARPDLGGGPVVLAEALLARLVDAAELQQLAKQLKASTAIRRIGSIADQLDVSQLAGKLQPLSPPTSDIHLDTRDTHREWRDSIWRVAWPLLPDELAADARV